MSAEVWAKRLLQTTDNKEGDKKIEGKRVVERKKIVANN